MKGVRVYERASCDWTESVQSYEACLHMNVTWSNVIVYCWSDNRGFVEERHSGRGVVVKLIDAVPEDACTCDLYAYLNSCTK